MIMMFRKASDKQRSVHVAILSAGSGEAEVAITVLATESIPDNSSALWLSLQAFILAKAFNFGWWWLSNNN
jgi:hypothetical protein